MLKRGEVSSQMLDLNEVIADALHLMKNEIARRRVIVSHDLTHPLPQIAADRIQLQQVLLNLILNACEAMQFSSTNAPQISITTKSEGTSVSVEITDNGHGLPADAESIFQPYYTTKEQGLGMGLAICRSIVTAHHGQLWAESAQAGCGATFHLVFPVKEVMA